MDSSILIYWISPFIILGVSGVYIYIYILYFHRNCCKFHVNSVEPDQMPHSVASDLCLHCLLSTSLSILWDVRRYWDIFTSFVYLLKSPIVNLWNVI